MWAVGEGLGKGLGVRLLGEEVVMIGDQYPCVSLLVFLLRYLN